MEAAPRDRVWGIGLSAKNWKAQHRQHWRGKSLVVWTSVYHDNWTSSFTLLIRKKSSR